MKVLYPRNFSESRNAVILEYCAGKKVLHIGAADAPYTAWKLIGNYWPLLYKQVNDVCREQLGLDLDVEAINMLNMQWDMFSHSKIIFFDMNNIKDLDFQPDVIIFWETIEHLMNLENALTNLKSIMDDETLLIISTPNAYFVTAFISSIFGREWFHDDHKVLFSYGYLENLLKFNQISVLKGYFTTLDWYNWENLNFFGKLRYALEFPLHKILKFNSDTILLICKKWKL